MIKKAKTIKFEKVSRVEFKVPGCGVMQTARIYKEIKIPTRATEGSAGYDFYSPISFKLTADHPIVEIPTGIRVSMPQHVALLIVPRSGMGWKTGVHLTNTIGVIDSDYYNANNEGHIKIKLERGFEDLEVKAGDRIAQGLFLPVFFVEGDTVNKKKRSGGFGSTGV